MKLVQWFQIFILIFTLSAACSSPSTQESKLKPGMNKTEVVKVLGKYSGSQKYGNYEVLRYNRHFISGWVDERADYSVILQNDKVTEFGPGDVKVEELGDSRSVKLAPK